MNHLYFVRHGQSQANLEKNIATFDSPLTEIGISQAKDTAKKLIGFKIDTIFSSPMLRAKQTAEAIAESLGFDKSNIVVVEELKERGLGELEENPKGQDSRWYFDTAEGYQIETHLELLARMKRALKQIESLSVNSKNVLIVGHSISGDMLRFITDKKSDFSSLADYELTPNAGYFELNVSGLNM